MECLWILFFGISNIHRGIVIKDKEVIYKGITIETSSRNIFEWVYGIIMFALIVFIIYRFHLW